MRDFLKAAVLTSALVGALVAPASAATTIGQTFAPQTNNSCLGSPGWEILQTGRADGTSYEIPANGVLTSWRFRADNDQETVMTLRVFRETGVPSEYRVVADGGVLQVIPNGFALYTFPTRISVQAGDFIGIHSRTGACASLASASDTIAFRSGTATPVGGTNPFSVSTSYIVDIAAELEADADNDGYGDETQDDCPSLPSTQDACPDTLAPLTAITRGAPDRTTRRSVRFRFLSSEPGSTFKCKRNRKPWRACKSPTVWRRLRLGLHTFKVRATDTAGNTGTAATDRFRVVRRRPAGAG